MIIYNPGQCINILSFVIALDILMVRVLFLVILTGIKYTDWILKILSGAKFWGYYGYWFPVYLLHLSLAYVRHCQRHLIKCFFFFFIWNLWISQTKKYTTYVRMKLLHIIPQLKLRVPCILIYCTHIFINATVFDISIARSYSTFVIFSITEPIELSVSVYVIFNIII